MTPEHRRTVDNVLLAVSKFARELALTVSYPKLADQNAEKFDLQILRQSRAGNDLADIAGYVEHEEMSPERARQAVKDVIKLLFHNPYMVAQDITPPKEFYETDLGRLISEAYAQMYLHDLITPAEAYKRLGVSRQMLYNYLSLGQLTPVYVAGRTMLIGSEVDTLRKARKTLEKS